MIRARSRHSAYTGFTLVETLVSIAIFSTSVVALLSVTSQGVTSLTFVKDKITASYLAQEGVEHIRNLRDTLVTQNSSSGWNTFLSDGNIGAGYCYNSRCGIVSYPAQIYRCLSASGSCPALRYSSAGSTAGYFGTATGTNTSLTSFSRTITMNDVPGGNAGQEVEVVATVSWRQGSRTHSVVVREYLFDWR